MTGNKQQSKNMEIFDLTSDFYSFLERDVSAKALIKPIQEPLAKRLKKHRALIKFLLKIYYLATGFGIFFILSAILYYIGSPLSHFNH